MNAPWFDRVVKRPEAAPVGFLAIVSLLLSVTTPGFSSSANLLNIVSQVAVVGIVSLALNQVILSGEIDVSIGSLLAACAFTFANVGHLTANPLLPLLAALGVGVGIGALIGARAARGHEPRHCEPLLSGMAIQGHTAGVSRGAPGLLGRAASP